MRSNETSRRLAKAVQYFWERYRYSPSLRDLKEIARFSSTSVVVAHLDVLQREGYLERSGQVARTVRLTPAGEELARSAPELMPTA